MKKKIDIAKDIGIPEEYIECYGKYKAKINLEYYENISYLLIKKLIHLYDIILIDTNHMVDAVKLVSMDLSNQILYVMTNDIVNMRNMKTMVSIYKDMDKDNFSIILNSALGNLSYNKYDVRNVIGTDVDYVLPKRTYNRNIQKNILEGLLPEATKNDEVIKKIVDDLLN